MVKHFCDKCRRIVDDYHRVVVTIDASVARFCDDELAKYDESELDLCPSCCRKFMLWLDGLDKAEQSLIE